MRQRIDRNITKQYILKTLPFLPKEALKEIQNSLNFFLAPEVKKVGRGEADEEIFYEFLRNKFEKELRIKYPNFSIFKKQTHYKKFRELVIFVIEYLKYNLKDTQSYKKYKMQFFSFFVDMMYESQKTAPFPVCMKTIINDYESFPAIVESNFPGYLKSGLIEMILDSRNLDKNTLGCNEEDL